MIQYSGGKNKFAVFGYFGGWNSGDEAILRSVCHMLREQTPAEESEIVAICTRVREEYRPEYERKRIRVIESRQLFQIFSILRTHQLVVGGGQMITGDRSLKGLIFLSILCLAARCFGRPARLIGIGVVGVSNWKSRFLVRRIVALSQFVGCRDNPSYLELVNTGCRVDRIAHTADVVFSGAIGGLRDTLLDREASPLAVGLHRSPIRSYSDTTFYCELIESLLVGFPSREIVVVSNDARLAFDAGLLNELQEKIENPRIKWQHFETLRQTLELYSTSACVVSVRMHPLILAMIHGASAVGIARSSKVKALGDRVGMPLFDPGLSQTCEIVEQVRHALSWPGPDLDKLRAQAFENMTVR